MIISPQKRPVQEGFWSSRSVEMKPFSKGRLVPNTVGSNPPEGDIQKLCSWFPVASMTAKPNINQQEDRTEVSSEMLVLIILSIMVVQQNGEKKTPDQQETI